MNIYNRFGVEPALLNANESHLHLWWRRGLTKDEPWGALRGRWVRAVDFASRKGIRKPS